MDVLTLMCDVGFRSRGPSSCQTTLESLISSPRYSTTLHLLLPALSAPAPPLRQNLVRVGSDPIRMASVHVSREGRTTTRG